MSSGVPQGWVLRPILFHIFINALPEKLAKLSSQVRLFADDTAGYLSIAGLDDGTVLQKDLDKLSLWQSQWGMEFNPSKCQVVRATTARKRPGKQSTLCMLYMVRSWKLSQVLSTWGLTFPMAYLGTSTLTVLQDMQIELGPQVAKAAVRSKAVVLLLLSCFYCYSHWGSPWLFYGLLYVTLCPFWFCNHLDG